MPEAVFFDVAELVFFAVADAVLEAVVDFAEVVFLAAAGLEAVVFDAEVVLDVVVAELPPFGASRRDFWVMPSAFAIAFR